MGSAQRSWALFQAFRHEQSNPEFFYRTLAADSVDLVARYSSLQGRTLLDVGGGPGYFRDAFEAAGATYVAVEPDASEYTATGTAAAGTIRASGLALPFRDASVDIAFCSNVAEHVDRPWLLGEELLRVTKPGGLVVFSYTLWWGPHGGHETSPWHYLGGYRAAQRYARQQGHRPKNEFGTSLFAVNASAGLTWAQHQSDIGRAQIVDARARYAPDWAQALMRVPLLRELLGWNLVLVLRP